MVSILRRVSANLDSITFDELATIFGKYFPEKGDDDSFSYGSLGIATNVYFALAPNHAPVW